MLTNARGKQNSIVIKKWILFKVVDSRRTNFYFFILHTDGMIVIDFINRCRRLFPTFIFYFSRQQIVGTTRDSTTSQLLFNRGLTQQIAE